MSEVSKSLFFRNIFQVQLNFPKTLDYPSNFFYVYIPIHALVNLGTEPVMATEHYPYHNNLDEAQPLQRQLYKMIKHTQTICRLLLTNFLSIFDHFWGLAFKGLNTDTLNMHFCLNLPIQSECHVFGVMNRD